MGRRLIVNGTQFDLSQDLVTGAQLKQELQFSPNSMVVIPTPQGQNVLITDDQYIPADAAEVDVMPPFIYGKEQGGRALAV